MLPLGKNVSWMRLPFTSNSVCIMFWIERGALPNSSSIMTTGLPVCSLSEVLMKNSITLRSLSGNGMAASPSDLLPISK